jgi:oligoendopeptidase F
MCIIASMEWDLSDHYQGVDDPNITKDKELSLQLAKKLKSDYEKIAITEMSGSDIKDILERMAIIDEIETKIMVYSHLLFKKDTQSEKASKLLSSNKEYSTKLTELTMWFSLSWKALDQNSAEKMINDKALSNYSNYLNRLRKYSKYTLKEPEEQIINKLSPVGYSSLSKIYEEVVSRITVKVKLDGKNQKLGLEAVRNIMSYHPDRLLRKRVFTALSKETKSQIKLFSSVLNNKLLNSKIHNNLRGYENSLQKTLLNYDVDRETLEALREAISESYDIVHRFYKTKSKLTGIKKLEEIDRYSAIYQVESKKEITFDHAKKIIVDTLKDFDNDISKSTEQFFQNRYIDSLVTPGKSSGAFCLLNRPSSHPFILVNYKNELSDVTTLAHEIGHGIHAHLSKKQNVYNFYPSTATAEIASTFFERLVFEKLLEEIDDYKERSNILAESLSGSFATIFRQMAFFEFEMEINELSQDGEIPTEKFNALYNKHLEKMFGDSLSLSQNHSFSWALIGHFFKYDYYVFTYSFGELLSLCLYNKYKSDGKEFVDKYKNMLSSGGLKSPKELLSEFGFDITSKSFWLKGIDILRSQLEDFEKLSKTH